MKKLILLLAVLTVGCNVQKRQVSKLHEYNSKYPNELALDCSKYFPVVDKYIKGDTVVKSDTVTKTVTVPCPEQTSKGQTVYVKVPLTKTITNTVTRIDTLVKVDSSKLSVIRTQYKALSDAKIVSDTSNRDNLSKYHHALYIAIGEGVLIVLAIAFGIYRAIKP